MDINIVLVIDQDQKSIIDFIRGYCTGLELQYIINEEDIANKGYIITIYNIPHRRATQLGVEILKKGGENCDIGEYIIKQVIRDLEGQHLEEAIYD